jgi:hypothetical protein
VGSAVADGGGYLRYEDTTVERGVRYCYRLGMVEGGAVHFAGDVWATAEGLALALERVQPNPSSGTNLTAQFVLPAAAPARLELIDVSGRRVVEREVGSLGPGRHSVALGGGNRIPPGVYLVRFSQGANVRTARAAVVR